MSTLTKSPTPTGLSQDGLTSTKYTAVVAQNQKTPTVTKRIAPMSKLLGTSQTPLTVGFGDLVGG